MAMSTENEKKDIEPAGIDKDVGATVAPAAPEVPAVEEPPVEEKQVKKQKPVENFTTLKSAIIYIAQHELDPAGFQDFKNLYPSLFE